jgi:hypothetical protein
LDETGATPSPPAKTLVRSRAVMQFPRGTSAEKAAKFAESRRRRLASMIADRRAIMTLGQEADRAQGEDE